VSLNLLYARHDKELKYMYVSRINAFDSATIAPAEWDRLAAGRFFYTWTWVECWWRHYRQDSRNRFELYTLLVYDDQGRVVGIAPWYIERSLAGAGTVRFLGSGEVCSDHPSLLCLPGREQEIADAVADWLADDRPTVSDWLTGQAHDRWDHLEFDCVDQHDTAMNRLVTQLERRGCLSHRRPGLNCWRIDLPDSWDAFLQTLSKNRRAQVRKAEARVRDPKQFQFFDVECCEEFERGWNIFVDLHQRRWESLGQPGCFASPTFTAFHREVAQKLLKRGELRLWWLEHQGKPISAEYHFVHRGVIYAYQSGIEPTALDLEPGRMTQIVSKRWAIDHQFHQFDYLRGDEGYKQNWRAAPYATWDLRIAAPRAASRIAHGVWVAKHNMKTWIKSGLRKAGYAK
jgi:predicted N-acyltransferase